MADLDWELSNRLSQLADAVPVSRGQLDRVHRTAVAGRQSVRLAWLTPLVVIVVGALVLGLTKVGPMAPGATPDSGPVTASTRAGDFELTIRSARHTYETGEPVEIDASLTYLGSGAVAINHAQGARVPGRGNVTGPDTGGTGGPIGFGIVEQVIDGLRLETGWDESCERSTLESNKPLAVPFEKSGSWSGNHPEFESYLQDPVLRLTTGTWHVFALAEFSIGGCGGQQVKMRAEIEIGVQDAPAASTAGATLATNTTLATDVDGDFSLTLQSDKARYLPDEPIDVTATLAFLGKDPSIEISHDSEGPVLFGIQEKVFGAIDVGTMSRLMCDRSVLERDHPVTESFKKSGGFSGDDPDAAVFEAWIKDPVFRLPRGTWHISAVSASPCLSAAPAFSLRAEIVIVVDDDPAATASNATPVPDRDQPVYGGDDIGDFGLQLMSGHSTYLAGDPIDISTWYRFMSGVGDSITVSHFQPEVAFSISEIAENAQNIRSIFYDSACQELTLEDGVDRHVALTDNNTTQITAVNWPPATADALKGGILQLPAGRWRITAVVQTTLGPCNARGENRQLHASIELNVVGTDNAEIELSTGTVPTSEDGTRRCLLALGGGILAVNSRTGLGFTDKAGTSVTDVVWPDGYTARYQDGRAILIDESGHVVATAGDTMSLGGGYSADNVFHVCGAGITG